MGSRPEVNQFIQQMTEANLQRLSKSSSQKDTFNKAYGPFALCNRKLADMNEQKEAQRKAYADLIHYVGKVRIFIKNWSKQKLKLITLQKVFSFIKKQGDK